eukprot:1142927-Pelagomonas_calceolata.AAC.5
MNKVSYSTQTLKQVLISHPLAIVPTCGHGLKIRPFAWELATIISVGHAEFISNKQGLPSRDQKLPACAWPPFQHNLFETLLCVLWDLAKLAASRFDWSSGHRDASMHAIGKNGCPLWLRLPMQHEILTSGRRNTVSQEKCARLQVACAMKHHRCVARAGGSSGVLVRPQLAFLLGGPFLNARSQARRALKKQGPSPYSCCFFYRMTSFSTGQRAFCSLDWTPIPTLDQAAA